jgi:hypothetical protein
MPTNMAGSTLVGTSLSADMPGSVAVTTKAGMKYSWPLNDDEGILLDPDISVARASLVSTTEMGEDGKPTKKLRIHDIIPWTEVSFISFNYEEKPLVATGPVN